MSPQPSLTAHDLTDDRFLADFRSMSAHGATPAGGVHREAGTPADTANRHWFHGLLEGYGATVVYDEIGNQFGLWELNPDQPYVLVGSHLDSQPFGGRFDGAYGVLCGAHACARLSLQVLAGDVAPPRHNVAVVNWFNEEGSRFKPSMMGSSVFTGKSSAEEMLAVEDGQAVTVREALEAMELPNRGKLPLSQFRSYAEIHIEQGKDMDEQGYTIGVVEKTWGARKYVLKVHGFQSHTGSTLLEDRQDALYGAALIITRIRQIGEKYTSPESPLVTSCGQLNVIPNSPVVVAQGAELLVDLRCGLESTLQEADQEFREALREIEDLAHVKIELQGSHAWQEQAYTPEGVALAESIARQLDLPVVRTQTRAGHDSTNIKDVLPTVMLFVPSYQGISHNELEFTEDKDMVAGLRMFTETLRAMASSALESGVEKSDSAA
ncbi:M20 family metallo-hydrolase [Rothia uropygialis]|uniref:M20 family metallo-hydrolase n=1 Tax=Kocuria sp. 36 TaxID=1415402 RepID=UPI00101D220C|nr:M20 family metallo-hydrolase [Kocuria sp. 36]